MFWKVAASEGNSYMYINEFHMQTHFKRTKLWISYLQMNVLQDVYDNILHQLIHGCNLFSTQTNRTAMNLPNLNLVNDTKQLLNQFQHNILIFRSKGYDLQRKREMIRIIKEYSSIKTQEQYDKQFTKKKKIHVKTTRTRALYTLKLG
ncbi:hypothetical protein I3760_13G058100 [Carya illinoinensis]|nr:hypothetical protein I3760_13G058100 [Carya illinoinensis]